MKLVVLDPQDIPELSRLLRQWEQSNVTTSLGLPAASVAQAAATLQQLAIGNNSCVLALHDGDQFRGFMGGAAADSHFCDAKILHETFWFVEHGFRRYSKRLVNGMKKWAESKGCTHIKISASMAANVNANRVAGLLKLWGFQPYEYTFIGALNVR